jgi:ferric-chelate reductase
MQAADTATADTKSTATKSGQPVVLPKPWKQEPYRQGIPSSILIVEFFMAFCVVYIAITSFAPEPVGLLSSDCPCEGNLNRCICPRPTVEALNVFQMFCLANSRVAAYACYPLYLILCLTMSRNLLAYLQHTVLVEYLPLPTSAHHLHFWAGTLVGILIIWHSLWHLIRWGVQDNWEFLIDTVTGVTGWIGLALTPIIVWPMRIEWLRKRISFETRKRLHYTSWIWMGLLCFHAPQRNVFWIVGSFLVIYWVDWVFGLLVATRSAPSARFVRLESVVVIRLKKPLGFQLKGAGGYCYLCIPWVSKMEWHAFSAFKDPHHDDYICFCISVVGDWTKKLHESVHEPIDRRLWINGPYPSPFEEALDRDNIISVASGIGITPALSVIKSLADFRKMHLIWMVRDASLLEFMFDFGIAVDDDAYTIIFYTGKRELVFKRPLPYNVLIFKGRPNLDNLIVSLVQATMNGEELDMSQYQAIHDHHTDVEGDMVSTPEHDFYKEVTRLLSIYSVDEIFQAAVRRSHLNSRNISYEGLKGLINDIFIRKFSDEQLRAIFDRADEKDDGVISRKEFASFMGYLEESSNKHNDQHRRSKNSDITRSRLSIRLSSTSMEECKVNNKVERPEHWRIMYCGGSAPVQHALEKVSAEHCIPLSLESFGW